MLIVLIAVSQDEIPFKPLDAFEVKLDYTVKQRPTSADHAVAYQASERNRSSGTGLLPYLVLNIKILKPSLEEVKYRIGTPGLKKTTLRKMTPDQDIRIDMGFVADIKDKVTPNEHVIDFLSVDKKPLSRIRLMMDEEGFFFVNGQQRGKF